MNKPVILLLLDGLGLSSSWQGNAFATAKLTNFEHLWRTYDHHTLLAARGENPSSMSDPVIAYSTVATGRIPLPNKVFLDEKVKNNEFGNNPLYRGILDKITTHSSSLHFIGSISKNNENASFEHLLELIRIAKSNAIFRINIHLLVDETFADKSELLSRINILQNMLSRLGVGEIVSISGQRMIHTDSGIQSFIKTINLSIGKRYLSPAQAIQNQDNILPKASETMICTKNNFTVNDFDGIIFFNHNPKKILSAIEAYASGLKQYKCPKYSFIVSLVDFPFLCRDNLTILFKNLYPTSLIHTLYENGIKSLVVSEEHKSQVLKHYFGLSNKYADEAYVPGVLTARYEHEYGNNIGKIVKLLASKIKDKKYDFILADLPVIENVCHFCTFDETVTALRYMDKLLVMLENLVIENDATLIIASPYGMAEKMISSSKEKGANYKCLPTNSPLPMIIISKETMRNDVRSSVLLNNFAYAEKDLSFVFTSVLNCFKII